MINYGYLIKGSFTIIAGVLTFLLAFVYLYNYKKNVVAKAKDKKVFGPTSLLVTNLLINITLLGLTLAMIIIYIKNSKHEYVQLGIIKQFCPHYDNKLTFIKQLVK